MTYRDLPPTPGICLSCSWYFHSTILLVYKQTKKCIRIELISLFYLLPKQLKRRRLYIISALLKLFNKLYFILLLLFTYYSDSCFYTALCDTYNMIRYIFRSFKIYHGLAYSLACLISLFNVFTSNWVRKSSSFSCNISSLAANSSPFRCLSL